MSILRGMNIGGGRNQTKKVELVSELIAEYQKLNQVLEKTKTLSADIANNLEKSKTAVSMAGGRGGGGIIPGKEGQFVDEPGSSASAQAAAEESASGMKFGRFLGTTAVAAVGSAIAGMPTNAQVMENRFIEQRMAFMSGRGVGAVRGQLAAAAMGGIVTNELDAARAAAAGMSFGLMPGANANVMGNAATFSYLSPGAGLEGGMRATAALNQAGSVNRLRMLGINVRGNDGFMRDVKDIANEVYDRILKPAAGNRPITRKAIALSLQSGGALDMFLNQYFGGDPVLRQGVVNAILQRAGGGEISKEAVVESGLVPDIAQSESERMGQAFKGVQAATDPMIAGIIDANEKLTALGRAFEDFAKTGVGQATLALKGFAAQLATGGNGAMGGFMGVFLGSLMANVIRPLFTKIGAMMGIGSATAVAGGGGAKGKMGPGGKLGLAAIAAWLATMGLDKMFGDDVSEGTREKGLAAASIGTYALTGAALGSFLPGPGTAIGAVLGTTYGAFKHGGTLLGLGGDASDDPGSMMGAVKPFSGNYRITSNYGEVRHLTFPSGIKSPSYGKPHGGIDFGTPMGTPIYAAQDGIVESTPYDSDGFGNYIKIKHNNGLESFYGHLASKERSGGSAVRAGELIGYSGNSGQTTGPHLHFEVRRNGERIHPNALLEGAGEVSGSNAGVYANSQMASSIQSILPRMSTGFLPGIGGGDGGSSVSYGGVSVTINIPKGTAMDETKLAREIKRVLADENQLRMAVTR